MKVGLLTLRFHLPKIQSIKEKRSIVKGILAEVERRGPAFACAEVEDLDLLDRATIRIAHLSNDPRHTDSTLAQLRSSLEQKRGYVLEGFDVEIV
jgi:uncharacterized protein YlxP (DUF503 family)